MYTGMLHTHKLSVVLFLIYLLVRTVLLLTNKTDMLQKLTKKLRIPDMVVSTLFLVTGIYLAFQTSSISYGNWFWIKLVLVFAAIPLAIIGFKKQRKVLALLSLVLVLGAYGVSETKSINMKPSSYLEAIGQKADPAVLSKANIDPAQPNYDPILHGEAVYSAYCSGCHGADGKLQNAGAKDLSRSVKTVEEMRLQINKGKNSMPGFEKYLSENQIDDVVAFVRAKLMDPTAQPMITQ